MLYVDQNSGSGSGSRVSESGSATLLSALIALFVTINLGRSYSYDTHGILQCTVEKSLKSIYSENFAKSRTLKNQSTITFSVDSCWTAVENPEVT